MMTAHSATAHERLAELVDSLEVGGEGHSKAVSRWATLIAIEMGLPSQAVRVVEVAGLLHDVGKIELPKELLNKPSRLTKDEFELVKQHPIIGARMLMAMPSVSEAESAVEHHHERWDGRGYPHGKRGADIPIEGRILAASEVFSSMTRPSPYRQPMTISEALDRLKWASGAHLDPDVVEALHKVIQRSIPSRMLSQRLSKPLEIVIASEVSKLKKAFVGLIQQLLWATKELLGERLMPTFIGKLNEALREDGLPIAFDGALVKDLTPWVVGLEERVNLYRSALQHVSLMLSAIFGDTFTNRLVRSVASNLPESLQETCSQYALHPALAVVR
ncbi:MAG: hypothetical protein HZRFUVUK_001095 [Candidatus Fervidibacterota bacterium]|jgi:putative nucleotidyltransferase with HDIG domain